MFLQTPNTLSWAGLAARKSGIGKGRMVDWELGPSCFP